jgi:uncharacterized protein YutE (UPF0331/DUF86 family)
VTNVALVAKKLAVLQEHLRRLALRRPESVTTLRADTLLQDAISMGVVLARHAVIADELAASLGGAAQLRNRIAHGYASLDVDRLWNELPAGTASFGEFAGAVARFVQAKSHGS